VRRSALGEIAADGKDAAAAAASVAPSAPPSIFYYAVWDNDSSIFVPASKYSSMKASYSESNSNALFYSTFALAYCFNLFFSFYDTFIDAFYYYDDFKLLYDSDPVYAKNKSL